jgi:Protein of unknown function (DUF1194)
MRLRQCFFAAAACAVVALSSFELAQSAGAEEAQVDTALIVSVDVSSSVDGDRYKLQMEGIAKALEDPGVIEAIVGGPNGGILFSMVTWADRPTVSLPWVRIASKEDAKAVAARVRKLPLQGGEFTCMTKMLRSANDKIVPQIPAKALRVVIDVSGDGPDNCNADEPIEKVRDELVANGVTINGLPILEGANADAGAASGGQGGSNAPSGGLEAWFKSHIQGGNGSFVLPANGYSDFARAIRQKFVIEISGLPVTGKSATAAVGGSIDPRFVVVDQAVEAANGRAPAKVE